MSFLRSSFSIRKTKPRKVISRSPLKLPAEELARELGPQLQTIDARIGDQKLTFDIAHGDWIAAGTAVSSREMSKLDKKKHDLEEDNNVLRTKVDILLEMLAEVSAEHQLRSTG